MINFIKKIIGNKVDCTTNRIPRLKIIKIAKIKNFKAGFTLIELIIVLGFFAFISALLMQNIFSIYRFKEVIRYKKDVNFEASGVLNNGIAGLIRSGFSINYANTKANIISEQTEGFQSSVDQISIFSDRAETQYFTIYREPYRSTGDNSDTARLMLKFGDEEAFPLHTSEIVIEDFDVRVPENPMPAGDRDLHPYVSLYVRARHRYPFGEVIEKENLLPHQNIKASYKTTYTLRNTVPSSYKR